MKATGVELLFTTGDCAECQSEVRFVEQDGKTVFPLENEAISSRRSCPSF
jgi:hypothetical protein